LEETAKGRRIWRDLAEKAENPQSVVVSNDDDDDDKVKQACFSAALSIHLNSKAYYSQSRPSYIKTGFLGWKFPEHCPNFKPYKSISFSSEYLYFSKTDFALCRYYPTALCCDFNLPSEIQSKKTEPKSDVMSELVVSVYEPVKWAFLIPPLPVDVKIYSS
jgi:hypothetical protein